MGEYSLYVILYSVGASFCYTLVILVGVRKSIKNDRNSNIYYLTLRGIIEEVKEYIIFKEENFMTELENKLTLTDLLTREPKEKHYEDIIQMLSALAKETYKQYKFFIAKSPNETDDYNFIQIVSHFSENPNLHKTIFAKSIEYNIHMPTLQAKFAEHVAKNNVIDLGEDVVVITDDGTGQLPTGVSPINSGLEGGEIAFIIAFIKAENYVDWSAKNLPKDGVNE